MPLYVSLALIWGSTFYLIMVGLQMFTPVGVAFGRIAFGAVTLLVVSMVSRIWLPPLWAWKHIFIVATLWVSVPSMLYAYGETLVSSAVAGIINAATPLMTLLAMLVAFPEEKPTRQRMTGLFLGFLGILIVVGVWNRSGGNDLIGMLALLGAVACYGIGFPYARKYLTGPSARAPINAITLAFAMLLCGLVVTGPIVAFTGVIETEFQWGPLVAIAVLGVLGSGLASVLNFKLMVASDATTASTVTYFTPLVAVAAGALLLNETISWNQPFGAIFVVVGAAIAQGVLHLRK